MKLKFKKQAFQTVVASESFKDFTAGLQRHFDTAELIKKCVSALDKELRVTKL